MNAELPAKLSILVVDHDDDARACVLELLRTRGHRVSGVDSAESVADNSAGQHPELYLIGLPGDDGRRLVARLRKASPQVGIVLVTHGRGSSDQLAGYASGADLCVSRQRAPVELDSIVTAIGRRLRGGGPQTAAVILHPAALRLRGPLTELTLTAAETRLLDAFSKAPEQLLERWQVATNLGMDTLALSESSLEVRVATLRRKLREVGADGTAIKAVRGIGYKLCVGVAVH